MRAAALYERRLGRDDAGAELVVKVVADRINEVARTAISRARKGKTVALAMEFRATSLDLMFIWDGPHDVAPDMLESALRPIRQRCASVGLSLETQNIPSYNDHRDIPHPVTIVASITKTVTRTPTRCEILDFTLV